MFRLASDWPSRLLAALAGVTVVLVIVNGVLFLDNQSAQREVNKRQLFINQSIQLNRIYEALVRAIAAAAVTAKDEKLRDLLAEHGITFTFTPSPGSPAAPEGASPAPSPAPEPPSSGK
jgi:hypothetical protein